MKLFLIRHGETPWTVARRYQGSTDIPLNRKGIQQAKAIARALKADPPRYLYTSALRRARQTAQVIEKTLGPEPRVDPRLNELHFGKWEGVSYPDLARSRSRLFKRWQEGKLNRPPGGESVAALARRVGEFFKEISERHSRDSLAIVAHGGPIQMMLFKALKVTGCSIGSFRIDPASISLLEGTPSLFQILWTNRTDHL